MFCVSKSRVCAVLTCVAVFAAVPMAEAQTYRKAVTVKRDGQTIKGRVPPPRLKKPTVTITRDGRPMRGTPKPRPTKTSFENDSVYRVQLRVTTANVKDAGTDDAVMVRLGNGPGTWIDSAADDHKQGRTYTYDLIPQAAGNQAMRIRDITMLNISKIGSDGWCVSSLELFVNGGLIYQTGFHGGHWLDNSKGKSPSLTITSLRSSPKWQGYKGVKPSPVIPQIELEQRIESIIGHYIHGDKKIQWGKLNGRGVEVTFKDAQTLHVDLDLKIVINHFPDAALDVDFDIKITSRNGAIDLTATNIQSRVTSKTHRALLAANGLAGGTNSTELNRMITKQIRQSLGGRPVSVSTGNLNLTPLVTAGGNVVLLPQF